jgi:hypothetical protein
MADYKKEWLDKAKIDYFLPFTSLWLSCNSWYKSHYAEITGGDRGIINKIKLDNSPRNLLYQNFLKLIEGDNKESINFKNNIEMLHYSLERNSLVPDRIKACSFRAMLIDYNLKDDISKYENMIVDRITSKIKQNGDVKRAYEDIIFRLDKIYIHKDFSKFFAGLIEIIYTIRNMLIHGSLNPQQEEHELVKYCYFILWDLMQ